MSSYATTRDEIGAQLSAVTGIGKLFKHRRHSTDWKTFLERFKTSAGVINVCWISRAEDVEAANGVGSMDEAGEITWVQEDEYWEIELFYGFKDDEDDGSPSEFAFNILVDAIETKFRYLQDLNDKAYASFPLNRVSSSFGTLGEVLCHRALWKLRVQHHI